jgi:E1A/CREB-binding protein
MIPEVIQLKNDIRSLELDRDYLLTLIDDDVDLKLFDDDSNSFTPQVRECVMKLTTQNVATKHVSSVIESVLKLANKRPNRLPSRQTIDNIVCEKIAVGQKQLGLKLEGKKNICLYGDETRKKGKTYQTFLVSDEEKDVFFLGLRDMCNKAASTTLDTFKDILIDISNACEVLTSNEDVSTGHAILSNIESFMSDRAKVNSSFTDLLQQFKSEVLPCIVEGWDELTNDQKVMCSKVNNFVCVLHLLVNMTECASPILKKFENILEVIEDDPSSIDETEDGESRLTLLNESKTFALMRFCSKCFSCGGDEKCGSYAEFKTFCEQKNEKVLFVPFRGNRFNIIFLIGEIVFYHKDTIQTFLKEVHGTSNFLQKTILFLITKPRLIAACKVLGLVSKLITAPFWRIVEQNINILDMNVYFETLTAYLERQSKDASGFISGEEYPFEMTLIEKDKIFEALIKPNDKIDVLAVQFAQLLFCGFHKLVSNAFKEHLPGGKYSNPSETLKEKSKAVIPHNKICERVFVMLDNFISFRPNASTITNEAFIMFSFNKTSEWLDSLPEEEKNKILTMSVSEGRELRKTFQDRCRAIEEKRKRNLEGKKNCTC